jgi:hypothetical protein
VHNVYIVAVDIFRVGILAVDSDAAPPGRDDGRGLALREQLAGGHGVDAVALDVAHVVDAGIVLERVLLAFRLLERPTGKRLTRCPEGSFLTTSFRAYIKEIFTTYYHFGARHARHIPPRLKVSA